MNSVLFGRGDALEKTDGERTISAFFSHLQGQQLFSQKCLCLFHGVFGSPRGAGECCSRGSWRREWTEPAPFGEHALQAALEPLGHPLQTSDAAGRAPTLAESGLGRNVLAACALVSARQPTLSHLRMRCYEDEKIKGASGHGRQRTSRHTGDRQSSRRAAGARLTGPQARHHRFAHARLRRRRNRSRGGRKTGHRGLWGGDHQRHRRRGERQPHSLIEALNELDAVDAWIYSAVFGKHVSRDQYVHFLSTASSRPLSYRRRHRRPRRS